MENLNKKLYKLESQQERLDKRIKRLSGVNRKEAQVLIVRSFSVTLDIEYLLLQK